jgi:hypothetical protein
MKIPELAIARRPLCTLELQTAATLEKIKAEYQGFFQGENGHDGRVLPLACVHPPPPHRIRSVTEHRNVFKSNGHPDHQDNRTQLQISNVIV